MTRRTLNTPNPEPGDIIVSRSFVTGGVNGNYRYVVSRGGPLPLGTIVKGGGTGDYRWVKVGMFTWVRLGSPNQHYPDSEIEQNLDLYGATIEHNPDDTKED